MRALVYAATAATLLGCEDFMKPPKNATGAEPEPSNETPEQTAATFREDSRRLLAAVEKRMWHPGCTADLPKGTSCGTIVQKNWREHLREKCGSTEDPGACANRWIDGVFSLLEGRYGGSAQGTADTCGSDCASPLLLELKMLEGYNKRLEREYNAELEKLTTAAYRNMANNAAARDAAERQRVENEEYNARVMRGFAAGLQGFSNSQPAQECSSSVGCPYNSVCVRAANSSRGFCAAR